VRSFRSYSRFSIVKEWRKSISGRWKHRRTKMTSPIDSAAVILFELSEHTCFLCNSDRFEVIGSFRSLKGHSDEIFFITDSQRFFGTYRIFKSIVVHQESPYFIFNFVVVENDEFLRLMPLSHYGCMQPACRSTSRRRRRATVCKRSASDRHSGVCRSTCFLLIFMTIGILVHTCELNLKLFNFGFCVK
jgi:hypothetical protein